jgi:hypothetical protein
VPVEGRSTGFSALGSERQASELFLEALLLACVRRPRETLSQLEEMFFLALLGQCVAAQNATDITSYAISDTRRLGVRGAGRIGPLDM